MLYFTSNIIQVSKYTDKKKRVHKEYGSYYSDHNELYRNTQHDFGLMPRELRSHPLVLEHDFLRCYCSKDSIKNW